MSTSVKISSTQELRYFNQYRILKALYFNQPISRKALSELTNLSVATITNLITTWLDEKVILESGRKQSQGGRPRILLTLNKEYGTFVGVDLGETHIRIELFDLEMTPLYTQTYWLENSEVQPEEIVEKIVTGYRELLATTKVDEEKIIGIGIGVPGVVELEGGISVFAPNWGWHNVSLLAQLQREISRPIILDNGAKAMGIAELWFGTPSDTHHLVALLLGTGVGTAIISDGQLQRGATNSAGELGHTTLNLNGRPCRCGGQGCLEAYVGAEGIIQTLQEIDPNSPLLKGNSQLTIITNIKNAADTADESALATITETAGYLGAGIANLINLYNPQTIILGGWLGNLLGPLFLDVLPPIIKKYALTQPMEIISLQLSQLEEKGIVTGAACLILEDFLHESRSSWRVRTGTVSLLSAFARDA